MRFWFYSIASAMILTSYDLYVNRSDIIRLQVELDGATAVASGNDVSTNTEDTTDAKEKPKESSKPRSRIHRMQEKKQALDKAKEKRHALLRQLVGASCDLLTPGAVVNYTPVSPAMVAVTSITSSLISSQDIWRKVNTKLH